MVERFNRCLKEQVIHGRVFEDSTSLRQAVGDLVDLYNREWLLGKLGYRSPEEAYKAWKAKHAA